MDLEKGKIVKLKKWEDIIHTLVEDNGRYNHKDNGLIVFPYCYMEDYNREALITEVDEDGDIFIEKGMCYYHRDWLDIV
jgi:hypothetical protein